MIIIPARLASKRFPNKILEKIDGVPMVIKTAQVAQRVDEVVVAVDDAMVLQLCKEYGIKAVMTSKRHKSGTDRLQEASTLLGLGGDEVIVNVQADEPFIEKEVIERVYELSKKHRNSKEILMNSAYKLVSKSEAHDPNLVKVVLSHTQMGIYFSRALIPYPREDNLQSFNAHLGIYGYTKRALDTFCALPEAPIEDIEKLEQLRAIYHGFKISMVEVVTKSFGIDTKSDFDRAVALFK